jgi:hypothetical protein
MTHAKSAHRTVTAYPFEHAVPKQTWQAMGIPFHRGRHFIRWHQRTSTSAISQITRPGSQRQANRQVSGSMPTLAQTLTARSPACQGWLLLHWACRSGRAQCCALDCRGHHHPPPPPHRLQLPEQTQGQKNDCRCALEGLLNASQLTMNHASSIRRSQCVNFSWQPGATISGCMAQHEGSASGIAKPDSVP